MKRVLMYLITFAVICSLADYSIDYTLAKQINKQSPYHLAFASIGANSLESRMDSWAKIRTTATVQDLESYLEIILKAFNLPIKRNKCVVEQNQDSIVLRYETKCGQEIYNFALESNNKINECYLVASFISNNKDRQDWKDSEKVFQGLLGQNWKSYYQYTASIDTVQNTKGRKEFLNVVMKNLGAKETELYQDGMVTSSAGYSAIIEENIGAIEVGEKKYNVQAAIRSSIKEGKTYVYIGSPLILGDY